MGNEDDYVTKYLKNLPLVSIISLGLNSISLIKFNKVFYTDWRNTIINYKKDINSYKKELINLGKKEGIDGAKLIKNIGLKGLESYYYARNEEEFGKGYKLVLISSIVLNQLTLGWFSIKIKSYYQKKEEWLSKYIGDLNKGLNEIEAKIDKLEEGLSEGEIERLREDDD